ncbi:hypothetical protein Corgl_1260 [Coriobacterium glomerans PW2]|uniref:Glycosyltransferase RgtA/B/C/D-like domain-containing protein n=1 Tax=Coriobacterium glomerans (strain ATCC 49209 / DSM 20642 / JCM 10262 / PW2) TaxID=700015 RepID=F2N8H8_CORGP|nr:hypothetical protein [Coriobacterium glomerans]AEB07361.1 hypothetical protein Corgl_1260 [Coriobacterium glomerans PW2]
MVIALGSAYLLAGAFHGNIWFDESYSLAISNHSISDIIRIGSADVHPVLYYIALWILRQVSGGGILACRLFSVAGSISLGLLGFGCVRRDYGQRVGAMFSFLALFTPYVSHMSVEIRMYSWCAFAVTLCFIFAARIYRVCCRDAQSARIPLSWWVTFHAASLASAYLHYFGTICALFIVVALYAGITRTHADRSVRAGLVVGAVLQVLCYLPWLIIFLRQIVKVESGFWITVRYPDALVQAVLFPFIDPWVADAVASAFGLPCGVAIGSIYSKPDPFAISLAMLCVLAAVFAYRRDRRCRGGLQLFASLMVSTLVLSAIGKPIFQYRYLYVAIGPLLLSCAQALFGSSDDSRVKPKVRNRPAAGRGSSIGMFYHARLVALAAKPFAPVGIIGVLLVLSITGKFKLIETLYSPQNIEPVQELREQGTAIHSVWTQDASCMGLLAITAPERRINFVDRWSQQLAYEAYSPGINFYQAGNWGMHMRGERFNVISRYAGIESEVSHRSVIRQTHIDLNKSFDNRFIIRSDKALFRPYEQVWYIVSEVEEC